MGHRFSRTLFALAFAAALGGCGSATPSPSSAEGSGKQSGMSVADARAFISKLQAERGTQPSAASVTSMEQFLEVLDTDELGRFEAASAFIAGKPGIDALTLHALLELLWSDGYSTVARLAEELGKRALAEAKRLSDQKESGRTLGDADEKALESARKSAELHAKAREALDVLAKDHLQTAVAPVNEALRQFPKDRRTYRVAAFYYLLAGEWEKYDTAAAWLKEGEPADAGAQYLRAMEAMRRFANKSDARGFLAEALKLNPKLVRAQAKLVLAEEGIAEKHAELEKLRTLAPRHPVVNIAGPAIAAEYEISASLERARGPESGPQSPSPTAPAH